MLELGRDGYITKPFNTDLLGKFLAGLFTLSLVLTAIWLMIMEAGILGIGVPPNGEEASEAEVGYCAPISNNQLTNLRKNNNSSSLMASPTYVCPHDLPSIGPR